MGRLNFEDFFIDGADFPKQSPLFDFGRPPDAHSSYAKGPGMPDDIEINPGYGNPPSILPYTILDDYSREKKKRALKAAVLENDKLRAVFIPALGGRLWSLFDKAGNRELLHSNPVFQPANLALRNAWFSGGIEWNISIIGHTPFTCSPLFAERLQMGELGEGLRMYEYERIREAVYVMDFFLPEGSAFLFSRMAIYNTSGREIPMYWWSNIAVEQTENTRVVVPADRALKLSYEDGLTFREIPEDDGGDSSYPANAKRAKDYFFYIEPEKRKFIAALEEDGRGFVHTSTRLLKGRKLFVWGEGPGGRRWQEFLSAPGRKYLEIQAGLGYSQMEYLKMPPEGEYEWLEAFGPIGAESRSVHGDWSGAVRAVGESLEKALPEAAADGMFQRARAFANTKGKPAGAGSGWAALELRAGAKLPGFLNFDAFEPEPAQKPWHALLDSGIFDAPAWPDAVPESYQISPVWRGPLEKFLETGGNAAAWFYYGAMLCASCEYERAREAFERSDALCPSAWARRGRAVFELRFGDREKGFFLYAASCALAPGERALAAELGGFAAAHGKYEFFIRTVDQMEKSARENPRVMLYRAKCLIELGRLDEGADILLSGPVVPDIREGEILTTELWYRMKEKELSAKTGVPEGPELAARVRREFLPPAGIDFRMG